MYRLALAIAWLPFVAMALAQEPAKPPAKNAEPKQAAPKAGDKSPGSDDIDVHKTAERIADNAQKAGERLKEKDSGADTRKIQKEILKDIDALIKKAQQPPPPPKSSDMNPMMPPPMGGMNGGMGGNSPPKPMGGMGGTGGSGQQSPMPMGGGASGNSSSKSGGGRGRSGRRPRERRHRGGSSSGRNTPMPASPGGRQARPARAEPKDGGSTGGGDRSDFGGFGKSSPRRQNDKLAELYKDVWVNCQSACGRKWISITESSSCRVTVNCFAAIMPPWPSKRRSDRRITSGNAPPISISLRDARRRARSRVADTGEPRRGNWPAID